MTRHLTDSQLVNYVFRALTDDQRAEMDRHLSACVDCRAQLAEHEAVQRRIHYGVIAQRNQTPAPRLAYTAIARRVHAPSRLGKWWRRFEGLFFTTLRVAVVLVTAIAVLAMLSNLGQPTAGVSTDALVGVYDNGNTPNGPESLTLLADGRFTQQFLTTGDYVTGTWTISAGQLEFFQIGISDTNNICNSTKGTYNWIFDGKALTLTAVSDNDCPFRQEDFTSSLWLKVTLSPAAKALVGAYDNSKTPRGLETLTLLDDGRFIQRVQDVDVPITGTWAISASQIVFTEAAGGGVCPGDPGTYQFVMEGKALTFTKVKDPYCDLRVEDFTSGPWIKKP